MVAMAGAMHDIKPACTRSIPVRLSGVAVSGFS
jgi:hypothetical protein